MGGLLLLAEEEEEVLVVVGAAREVLAPRSARGEVRVNDDVARLCSNVVYCIYVTICNFIITTARNHTFEKASKQTQQKKYETLTDVYDAVAFACVR